MSKSSELFIQIQEELVNATNKAIEGEKSHLETLLYMREIRKQAETTIEIIKDYEDSNIQEIINEASKFQNSYGGFEIREVSGRKIYNFKGISEIEEKESEKKELEEKYKTAFIGFQKGTVQTTTDDEGNRFWIDENGELKPFPELNVGKSYLSVKKQKQNK